MEIVTERLRLREFTGGDLPVLVGYHADSRYGEFAGPDDPQADARELFRMFIRWADERPRRNYQLAVAERGQSGELLGCCGVRTGGFDAGRAEFGIELAPDWWRHGYATEAARAILEFGFHELGLQAIGAVSVTENAPVTRLAQRLGFRVVGRRPGPAWMEARGWSHTEWALTRELWEAHEA